MLCGTWEGLGVRWLLEEMVDVGCRFLVYSWRNDMFVWMNGQAGWHNSTSRIADYDSFVPVSLWARAIGYVRIPNLDYHWRTVNLNRL